MRLRWISCALMLVGLVLPASSALAGDADIVTSGLISGPSGLPEDCTGDSTEGEVSLAVNPKNPMRMQAAWVQGNGQAIVAARSVDAGKTWDRTPVPGGTACTGGGGAAVLDPSLSIGPDGTTYLSSIADATNVFVNRSENGGGTWLGPALVDSVSGNAFPSVVADPIQGALAYALWGANTLLGPVPVSNSFKLAHSSDGGQTFSSGETVDQVTPPVFDFNPRLVVLRDQTLVTVYQDTLVTNLYQGASSGDYGSVSLYSSRSSDRGATWSDPLVIDSVPVHDYSDPDSGGVIYPHCCLGLPAAGPGGTMYTAYTDNVSTPGAGQVLLSRSDDGAQGWGPPTVMAVVRGAAFQAQPAVMPDGTVGVFWYDTRNDVPGDDQLTVDAWFAHSHDKLDSVEETHLAGPFNLRGTGQTNLAPLGDYQSIVPLPDGFAVAFTVGRPIAKTGATDIAFARIRTTEPLLRGTVEPGVTRVGRRTKFSFKVYFKLTSGFYLLGQARVRLAGKVAKTNQRGETRIVKRFKRPGRYLVTLSADGYRTKHLAVRVLPRRRR